MMRAKGNSQINQLYLATTYQKRLLTVIGNRIAINGELVFEIKPTLTTKTTTDNRMNSMQRKKRLVWWSVSGVAGAALMILGLSLAQAQPPARNADSGKSESKKAKPELTGAELYQINCNRCHSERYPTEFTAAQWKTIMLEMRVRANLPADQAQKILKFLQEDSGN